MLAKTLYILAVNQIDSTKFLLRCWDCNLQNPQSTSIFSMPSALCAHWTLLSSAPLLILLRPIEKVLRNITRAPRHQCHLPSQQESQPGSFFLPTSGASLILFWKMGIVFFRESRLHPWCQGPKLCRDWLKGCFALLSLSSLNKAFHGTPWKCGINQEFPAGYIISKALPSLSESTCQ